MHEEPSKSALKREAQRLQKIGLRLTQLKPDVRARIDLPDALRQAIETHAAINSREGGRRQMQFIGKLMRKVDIEAIEAQPNLPPLTALPMPRAAVPGAAASDEGETPAAPAPPAAAPAPAAAAETAPGDAAMDIS